MQDPEAIPEAIEQCARAYDESYSLETSDTCVHFRYVMRHDIVSLVTDCIEQTVGIGEEGHSSESRGTFEGPGYVPPALDEDQELITSLGPTSSHQHGPDNPDLDYHRPLQNLFTGLTIFGSDACNDLDDQILSSENIEEVAGRVRDLLGRLCRTIYGR